MKTTTTISKATRVFPLLVSLSFIVGCSDRLAPPTANSSTAERTVAFSWIEDETKYPAEGPRIATINIRGRDRHEVSTEGGTILAMQGDMMVVSTVDEYGLGRLLYGSIDSAISSFTIIAEDNSDERVDRGSVTISDNGERAAWYVTGTFGGISLEIIDLRTVLQGQASHRLATELSGSPGVGALPPPSFSPDGSSIAYIDFNMDYLGFVLKVAPTNRDVNQPPQIIAYNPIVMSPGAIIDWNPIPGDDRILYSSLGSDLQGAINIVPVNDPLDTSVAILANNNEFALSPSWAPDGKTFAFVTQTTVTGRTRVHTVNTESGAAATLAEARGTVSDLKWSDDGSQLLYTDSDGMIQSPDFTVPAGTLMTIDVAAKNAIPLATHVLKGFWVSE